MEGRRISTSVLAAPQYIMLNGKTLTRDQLSAAGIAATDITASNGIVHVINSRAHSHRIAAHTRDKRSVAGGAPGRPRSRARQELIRGLKGFAD
jgi:hypothetical protein